MAGKIRLLSALGAIGLVVSLAGIAAAQNELDDFARRASAKVRPGDRIGLLFLRERQMSESLYVDERGEAAFPKIGVMKVSDMTIATLQDTLRARYAEFFRLPELQIAVLRRVIVNGEVRIPNVYLMDVASSTVRDAIARAGGMTEMANRGKVWVIRGDQRIRIKNWDRESGPIADLESGDQVQVGRRSWFAVNALPVISTGILVASFIIQQSKNP